MYKLIILLLVFASVLFNCSPKVATSVSKEDYSEDLSAFRPKVDEAPAETDEPVNVGLNKGTYVPPTHDINQEMSVIMDSIIFHNQENTYLTYTVQVFMGRSRERANQAREKVYRVFPEEEPSLIYKQPSYKVNVGKFFDRVEAYKALTDLRKAFPAAILVPERNYLEEGSP